MNSYMREHFKGILLTEEDYEKCVGKHIENVRKAWLHDIEPHIEDEELKKDVNFLIRIHDNSLYKLNESSPYVKYLYDGKFSENDFNEAYLNHIHHNQHHWQYWVIIEENGAYNALDIPTPYLIEMICDWQSNHYYDEEYSIMDWYEQYKDNLILSDSTRQELEKWLNLCFEKGEEVI